MKKTLSFSLLYYFSAFPLLALAKPEAIPSTQLTENFTGLLQGAKQENKSLKFDGKKVGSLSFLRGKLEPKDEGTKPSDFLKGPIRYVPVSKSQLSKYSPAAYPKEDSTRHLKYFQNLPGS